MIRNVQQGRLSGHERPNSPEASSASLVSGGLPPRNVDRHRCRWRVVTSSATGEASPPLRSAWIRYRRVLFAVGAPKWGIGVRNSLPMVLDRRPRLSKTRSYIVAVVVVVVQISCEGAENAYVDGLSDADLIILGVWYGDWYFWLLLVSWYSGTGERPENAYVDGLSDADFIILGL